MYRSMIPPSKNEKVKLTPNVSEIEKIVQQMTAESEEKHKQGGRFNELGAEIVKHGIEDKQRARGWPTGTKPPVVSDKQML